MAGKIQRKFFLWSSLIMLGAGLFLSTVLYFHLRTLLTLEVKDKAHLVFAQVDAVQNYVRRVLRPTMYHLLPDNKFILQAMSSSYISRQVMERISFHKDDHYYRRVAINARNQKFEPNSFELTLIKFFQKNSDQDLWEGYRKIGKNEYYLMARAVRFDKSCMHCHGRPEDAPREIINIYGDKRGFGHRPGEIAGLDVVGLPVHSAVMHIRGASLSYALMVFAGGIFFFAVLNVLFNRLVVHDLRKILDIFKTYFNYDYKPRRIRGKVELDDEIDEIIYATEDLAQHLIKARKELQNYAQNLERMVKERTKELAQEAEERRLDVNLFVELLSRLNISLSRADLLSASMELIGKRFQVDQVTYVCSMASHFFYSWPEKDKPPRLPESWEMLVAQNKPVFAEDHCYIPVLSGEAAWGLLCLFWNRPVRIPRQMQSVLLALGQQLAIAIENLQALDELLKQKNMLQSIFEGISDPLLLLDGSGSIIIKNSAAEKLVHFFEASSNNPTLKTFVLEQATLLKEKGREHDLPLSREFTVDSRILVFNFYPLKETDRIVLYVRDVTKEKNMLIKMQQSEKMIAVGRLAAGLAHEINNPLGVILCYAQILRGGLEDEQQIKDLDVIIKHTKMAQRVLQDLLNFARPKQADNTRINLEEVISALISVFKVQADMRKVKFTAYIAKPLPLIVGDRAAIEQVLTNLFLNSLDAVPSGTGRIELRVDIDKESNRIVLSVRDNGAGIDLEEKGKIFDPFYTTKEPGKGTGLGLAVVYSLVQEMGGEIRVRNDNGAVFEVLLNSVG
ncbi:c-type heme family protein [Desulfovulcanus sp.]